MGRPTKNYHGHHLAHYKGVIMKSVKAIVQIDLGVFTDQEDCGKHRLCQIMTSIQDLVELPVKTLEMTVRDIDTNLITDCYGFGEPE